MDMYTYVNFAGTCREAFKYYEKHLGGKVVMMMTHGEAPGPTRLGPEWKDAVLHARISIADTELAGADIPAAQPMRSAYLSLNVDTDTDAERIFTALADGGEVLMKLEETFFASRFGQVRDRFGINWMVLRQRAMQT
jgi:PhnB protein